MPVTSHSDTAADAFKQTRIVFMGTPQFSASILEHLIAQHFNIVAVYTQADKPIGRKQSINISEVKHVAQGHSLAIEQPIRWTDDVIEKLRSYKPDLILVAAYGKILPKAVLDIPQFGCLNFHASLLPRWRGASPVQNTLLAGDTETGVTLMLMDEHMDTGDIIAQVNTPITPTNTTPSLLLKLEQLSTKLIDETLPLWIAHKITAQPQDPSKVTLCQLIDREDGRIFWNETVEHIERKYRAFTPWPGLFFFWKRKDVSPLRIKLITATFYKQSPEEPGRAFGTTLLLDDKTLAIQCNGGFVLPTSLQVEGKKPVSIKEFLSGYPDCIGTQF